ncbi:MAG: carbon-nitrogen hydrolase family protein [Candidatus Bathyarchaeota archaeon]
MTKTRISLIHMEVTNSVNANLNKADKIIRKAAKVARPNFICLPEYFSMPPTINNTAKKMFKIAYPPTVAFRKRISAELHIHIVGGTVIERYKGDFYNTSMLLKNGEILGRYRKINLTELEIGVGIKEGAEHLVQNTKFGKVGILVCADILFPETVQTLTSTGAEIVFLPISQPSGTYPSVKGHPLSISNAKDNLIFILKNGCVGLNSKGDKIGSKSAIISPWGVIKEAKSGNKEEVISANLDLEPLRELRRKKYG